MPACLLNINWATLRRPNSSTEFALPVECFNSKHGFSLSNQCEVTIAALAASNFLTMVFEAFNATSATFNLSILFKINCLLENFKTPA